MRRREKSEGEAPRLVRWDDSQIIIEGDEGEIASFRWDAVGRIVAFKQDLWAVDRIWLAFESEGAGGDHLGAVHEEVTGYVELVGEIIRRCAGCDPEWWTKAAFPAFAMNPTVVWERAWRATGSS